MSEREICDTKASVGWAGDAEQVKIPARASFPCLRLQGAARPRHGGEVEANNRPEGGARVIVALGASRQC